ncbi:WD40 repeat-like protein [Tilletia horrida]|uniref:WD40 repeat-like protein n=1 Tax=Tilletia horrida TaxID=155126 RepID=A0AAN6JKP1_9BASI|nr:WD40 repeat-like protein [Tilletia horrida]
MSATLRALYPANPITARAQSTKLGSDAHGTTLSYAAGRTAIIRPLDPTAAPTKGKALSTIAYAEHAQPTTAVRISPSGFYAASADAGGSVRIWDLVGTEQILKAEVKVVAGRLNDLGWDGEGQRMIAAGSGREFFGRAFLIDTGSSAGEISGHSKPINAVALKPQRPFRAVTASDDNTLVFYHGVPFKYNRTLTTHSRFVQDVSYAPNGERFVSVGSDGKVFVYEGKTGDVLYELSAEVGASAGHSGTIFAVDFAPDSKRIVTASADGTAKVWDVDAKQVLGTWDFNGKSDLGASGAGQDKALDQQVGVTWLAGETDGFASVSLSGEINVVSAVSAGSSSAKVAKLHGACASISSLVLAPSSGGAAKLLAGTFDGRVIAYDAQGRAAIVQGPRHGSAVAALVASAQSSNVLSIGLDETLRLIGADGTYSSSVSAGTTGNPKFLALGGGGSGLGPVFVGTPSGIDVFPSLPSASTKSHVAQSYTISSLAAAQTGTTGKLTLAVGAEDGKVHLYAYGGGAELKEVQTIARQGVISALAFSPDGALLAVGEGNGKITVHNTADWSLKTSHWSFHTARVQTIQFSPDSTHAVSGSLDTHAYIWSVAKPMKRIQIPKAHANGVTAVAWLDDATVASAGADACIKIWDIKKHE